MSTHLMEDGPETERPLRGKMDLLHEHLSELRIVVERLEQPNIQDEKAGVVETRGIVGDLHLALDIANERFTALLSRLANQINRL